MSDQPALFLLVQQLQQELQNQRVEIQSLRADVQRLSQNQSSSVSRPRLPDPPRFNGKPYTLRTWLPSIQAKIRSDQLTGADAFDYVWDRLEQPQQASALHLRQEAESSQHWDPEEIFSFFQRLCHNPRQHQEAVQRFSSVRQHKEESLIAYLARFERLAHEAEAVSWPDVSRITTLHHGLRQSLRQSLEDSNDSLFSLLYDEYIELVQRVDRRTFRPPANQSVSQPTSQSTRQHPSRPIRTPQAESMDVDPVPIMAIRPTCPARPASPALSSSSLCSTDSMSSVARRQYRLNNDLCLYCGAYGHWISDCPSCRSCPDSSISTPRRTKTTARSPALSARVAASQPN